MTTGDPVDEFETPVDLGIRRNASTEARALADFALALAALANDVGTSARRIDELEGAERAGFLAGLSKQLGDIAEAAHDARRIIADL